MNNLEIMSIILEIPVDGQYGKVKSSFSMFLFWYCFLPKNIKADAYFKEQGPQRVIFSPVKSQNNTEKYYKLLYL